MRTARGAGRSIAIALVFVGALTLSKIAPALVPWTFFAYGLGQASNSLVGSSNLIKKIYFPRLIIPLVLASALWYGALVYLGGRQSHAFTKGPILPPTGQKPVFDESGRRLTG